MRSRLVAVAAATAAALVVWVVAGPVLGNSLRVQTGPDASPMEVGPVSVIATAVIASLAGWALLAVLERLVARPARVWTVIAVAAAALSMAGPLTSGLTTTTTIVLAAMHLVVAAVLIRLFRRTGTQRQAS